MCGSPAAPCLRVRSSTRPAVGLEAGAGQPLFQNLETFCAPGGAVAGPELDCALHSVSFLRTCWSIITDELTEKKP